MFSYMLDLFFREMNVTDSSLSDAIESCFGVPFLMNFVCQTRADYGKFYDIFQRNKYRELGAPEGGFGVNIVGNPGRKLEDYSSMSRNDLAALGFDGFLADAIEAGPTIMIAIFEKTNAHRVVLLASGLTYHH